MNFLKRTIVLPFIFVIQLYKIFISPILPPSCRYSPSCSTYAIDALKKYGLAKGIFLAVKRIGSCHPWGGRGFDPVP